MWYTPSQAISRVRTRLHATSSNYPDIVGIDHYNFAYQDITGDMQLLEEEYFYTYWLTGTIVNQEEYEIKLLWTVDINQLKRVFIKYSTTDTDFIPVRRENQNNLTYDKEYYKKNQDKNDPFYYIQDRSIWIFPAPTEAIANWLKVEVITQPPELLTTDTVDKVLIPNRIQRVIEDGMMPYAYEYVWKDEKVPNAIQLFDKRKKEALQQVKKRDSWVVTRKNSINKRYQ